MGASVWSASSLGQDDEVDSNMETLGSSASTNTFSIPGLDLEGVEVRKLVGVSGNSPCC